jgi:hypothetical protein
MEWVRYSPTPESVPPTGPWDRESTSAPSGAFQAAEAEPHAVEVMAAARALLDIDISTAATGRATELVLSNESRNIGHLRRLKIVHAKKRRASPSFGYPASYHATDRAFSYLLPQTR